jgi:hypothetical protein
MECASRGLAFHSYQTSQEIIYQEHLAKNLTDKFNTLSQQMDQIIHEANSQIKALQDKIHGEPTAAYHPRTNWTDLALAMQQDHVALEANNHELINAFKEKSKSQQHITKLYQALKAQVMASHVATAAGDEAELTLNTARGDRFIDRLPGTRTGTANYSQMGIDQQMGGCRPHLRTNSHSSDSTGQHPRGGINLGPAFAPHSQGRGLGGRMGTGRELMSFLLTNLLLISHRVCTGRHPFERPSKPSTGDRRLATERFPKSKRRPSVSKLPND